jgi:hypothetical protein
MAGEVKPSAEQRTEEEVGKLTSVDGVFALLGRFVEVAAPIAEDGGSDKQLEAFSEVFADAAFVVSWLQANPWTDARSLLTLEQAQALALCVDFTAEKSNFGNWSHWEGAANGRAALKAAFGLKGPHD